MIRLNLNGQKLNGSNNPSENVENLGKHCKQKNRSENLGKQKKNNGRTMEMQKETNRKTSEEQWKSNRKRIKKTNFNYCLFFLFY